MKGSLVVSILRQLRAEAAEASPGPYRGGYLDALDEAIERVEDELWDEGEEAEEE